MAAFRVLLLAVLLSIAVYTAVVVSNHGMGLLTVFFGDISAMAWPGQFNLDFLSLLTLSGLWVAWRHGFSAAGLALGLLAFFGGGLFLSAYLLVVTGRSRGDMKRVLLGESRAAA